MGISAYTCFAMVIVYMLASVVIFLKHKTTIAIIGAYLNLENPLFVRLQKQHDEMVMGFANLIRFQWRYFYRIVGRQKKYVKKTTVKRSIFYRRQYSGKGRYDIVDKKMRTGEDTYGSYGNRTISGAWHCCLLLLFQQAKYQKSVDMQIIGCLRRRLRKKKEVYPLNTGEIFWRKNSREKGKRQ